MFFKIAIHNVKRSLRDYAIYFLTLTFGVCLFYVFNSMDSQSATAALNSSQKEIIQMLTNVTGYVSIFISIILGFLMVYSNRFLMKRRKKELGIYMLLGMDKSKISHILITETLLIGLFSLGVGLAIGIFASQGLSAITASIFEMDLSSFQFSFSLNAFLKTLLYFGIIFIVVMIFNTISISKYKLITLLQADKKNETFKITNSLISVIALLLSIACIAGAYYLILTKGWESLNMMLICIILGSVGTLLFFFALSGILLRIVKANKKLYYKGLNAFIFRQLSSKINTNFLSVGLICLMLFVTMVTFSAGLSVAHSSSQNVKSSTPYDMTISERSSYYDEDNLKKFHNSNTITNLELKNVLDQYASEYFAVDIYEEYLFQSDIISLMQNVPQQVSNHSVRAISLTDCNRVLTSQGKEPIALNDNEFAIIYNAPMIVPYYHLEKEQTITFNGKNYQLAIPRLINLTLSTNYGPNDSGSIILPDNAFSGLYSSHKILNVTYKQSDAEYAKEATNAFREQLRTERENVKETTGDFQDQLTVEHETVNENFINWIDKQDVYQSNIGGSVLISYLSIYIGLVFIITCVAILALQQLSEASDNTFRYNLLRKLGADAKMIHRALFTQIAIYFAMPLVLAIIHTIVGIQFSSTIILMFGSSGSILTMSIVTAGIIVLIYGGYFIATYLGCKSMIRPKKS